MYKYFKLFCFISVFYTNNYLYSATVSTANHHFSNMSCRDLLVELILESSFNKTFSELRLAFGFERIDHNNIMIKVVRKIENNRNGVYANLELNLASCTLNNIDREESALMEINKEYVPFIAEKCTPEENLYVNTGRLPNKGD